jgi:hypothetical protein
MDDSPSNAADRARELFSDLRAPASDLRAPGDPATPSAAPGEAPSAQFTAGGPAGADVADMGDPWDRPAARSRTDRRGSSPRRAA